VKCSKFPFLRNNVGAAVGGTDYSEENHESVLLNVTSVPDTINGWCSIDVQDPHLIGLHDCDWSVPGERKEKRVFEKPERQIVPVQCDRYCG